MSSNVVDEKMSTKVKCRCGGNPKEPRPIEHCTDRWIVECEVESCLARNIGQGLEDVILGWNRLSNHFYR
jgi:hypothetical protein